MVKKIAGIAVFATVAGMTNAEDLIDYSRYVQFEWINTSQTNYCFSRKNGWSSGSAPAAGFKYYVPSDKVLASNYSEHDPLMFEGDELAIAGGFLHVRESGSNKKTAVPAMAFCSGGYFTCGKNQKGGFMYLDRSSTNSCMQIRSKAGVKVPLILACR